MRINLVEGKTVLLNDGTYLHFWQCNRAGRGSDNVTVVHSMEPREESSRKQKAVALANSCHWKGVCSLTKIQCTLLGVGYEEVREAARAQGLVA